MKFKSSHVIFIIIMHLIILQEQNLEKFFFVVSLQYLEEYDIVSKT